MDSQLILGGRKSAPSSVGHPLLHKTSLTLLTSVSQHSTDKASVNSQVIQVKGFGPVRLRKPHSIDILLPSPTKFLCIHALASSDHVRTNTKTTAPFSTLPELVGPSIVIKTVKWHFEDFVGLPQAIPCSVVPFVHLYCMSVKEKQMN